MDAHLKQFFQSGNLDVQQFDRVVEAFFEGSSDVDRQRAQAALTDFKSHPDAWQVVDRVLDQSPNIQSKFIALGILENFIKVKWNLLPMENRLAIRNYIVKLVIDSYSQATRSTAYINKLDLVLVQIVKKDWPTYWPTFIQEIVDSSLANEVICVNNMKILKYLSEEIFDYSDDYMTKAKMQKLRNQLMNEFSLIFDLCSTVLLTSQQSGAVNNSLLVTSTLETLLKFLSWIPRDVILQQNLLQMLEFQLNRGTSEQKILILQSFTEVVKMFNDADATEQSQHHGIINVIIAILFKEFSMDDQNLNDNDDVDLLKSLSGLLTSSLTFTYVSQSSLDSHIIETCLNQLIYLTFLPDNEIRKTCLEYWKSFVIKKNEAARIDSPIQGVLTVLATKLIENMVQPDNTLYIAPADSNAQNSAIMTEFVRLGYTERALASLMHELLYYLNNPQSCRLIHELILTPSRDIQLVKNDPTRWRDAYGLMWASAAVIHEEAECENSDEFAEKMISRNAHLIEPAEEELQKNDAVFWIQISGVCYAAQYCRPQLLIARYSDFTRPLLTKLLHAMTQPSIEESVKDFCCHAFLKLSALCKECVVTAQPYGHGKSLLEDMMARWNMLNQQLTPTEMIDLYKAAGTIITALPDLQLQQTYLTEFMNIPNQLMSQAMADPSTLLANSLKPLRVMLNVLKINKSVCRSSRSTIYYHQLSQIQPYLSQAYAIANQYISKSNGNEAIQYKLLCQLKQHILELLDVYYTTAEKDTTSLGDDNTVMSLLSLPFELIQVAVTDFKDNNMPAERKDAKVLSLLTTIVTTAKNPNCWPQLFQEAINVAFSTALPFITSNFSDFPDIRREFYRLLKALNECCFMQLYQTPGLFQINMDSIMWGTKHTLSDISHLALQICLNMINYVAQLEDEDISSQFFEQYYVRILTDILEIVVDPDCRNGFEYQSQILARMLALIQEGEIYTRVFNPEQVSNPLMSNIEFLQQYVLDLLCHAFPLLQRDQIEVLVRGMFDYSDDLDRFQKDLRDFLIDITEVGEAGVGEKREQEEVNAELELLRDLQ